MAITSYSKDGKTFYRVYAQARSKQMKRVRLQKVISGIETLTTARREEKRLIKELNLQIAKREGKGLTWEEVIARWETSAHHGHLGTKFNHFTIKDHVNRLKRYTKPWMNKIASDLSKGDGRRVLEYAKNKGAKATLLKSLKNSINTVYCWGIEERLVLSQDGSSPYNSPVHGIGVDNKKEKIPPILTLDEVRTFLFEAKLQDHPWYPVWAFAVLTGMRSGELFALEWSDIDEDNGIIRVSKSFSKKIRSVKSTKNGRWRNINISPQLNEIIIQLKSSRSDKLVLPRLAEWKNGGAGKVLRMFLKRIGINKYVTFHTLRACFATHLLATGAEPMKVMRMGGWSDLKTFQIYLRMAGVDVKGVSDALDVLPQNNFDNVISLM